MISGYRVENGVQIYNDGAPAPPGWSVTFCCCIPMFKVSGIPEGTPRVPEDEAKARALRRKNRPSFVQMVNGVMEIHPAQMKLFMELFLKQHRILQSVLKATSLNPRVSR